MVARRVLKTAGALVPLLVATQAIPPTAGALPAPAAVAAQSPLTAATARALAADATERVIVELKARPTAGTDRAHAAAHMAQVRSAQAPLLGELAQVQAKGVKAYKLLSVIAATVSKGEKARLAANPAVAKVISDSLVRMADPRAAATQAAASVGATPTATPGTAPLPGVCAAPGEASLPEYLSTMHVASNPESPLTAQGLGYTGKGVTAAFIAEASDVNNPDFIRPDGTHVFVDYQDFSGVGTANATPGIEAYIDSSGIAAQGRIKYDVSQYSALPLNRHCDVRVLGVAPGASLVGLNVFGAGLNAFTSNILDAIDYAAFVDHVQVLNESFGSNPYPDSNSLDLTKQANDAAVAAGTTVVVSSGDAGVSNTIGSPASDPNVISAGATTTYRLYLQDGYGGGRLPAVKGWLSNNISSLSSSGFDQRGRTIDVAAPGDLNWVLCSVAACGNLAGQPTRVYAGGGTSQSAPLTSGTAALVIEAYAKAHGGIDPAPAVVKQIITSTASDIGAPGDLQGTGEVDAYRAVLAAASYPGATVAATGNALLTSTSQLHADGPANTDRTVADTVTNVGSTSQTVQVSGRTLGTYDPVARGTVTLSDATSPKYTDYQGLPTNLETANFTVPSGADRLSVDIAYQGAPGGSGNLGGRVRLTLVDPNGKLAGYGLPQGEGNHDNSQVTSPVAGTWTAYIWSRTGAIGGSTGPVLYRASVASNMPFGTVSPSTLTLAPGQSGVVKVTAHTPLTPGDRAGSLILTTNQGPAFAQTSTIPVTLRALAPTPAPTSTFTGTLVGGNGRQTNTGQAAFYQFDVPAGAPALNADVTLANNPNNPFLVELVDPVTGTAASASSNSLLTGSVASGPTYTLQLGAQVHVLSPDAGRWTLIINFYDQVSGTTLAEPYRVSLSSTTVPARATGIPTSTSVGLTAGKATTAYIRVHNNGAAPEEYFVDGRLAQDVVLQLPPIAGSSAVIVPFPATEAVPQYLVPSHTSAIATAVSAPVPIAYDYGWSLGDPDLGGTAPPLSGNASGTYVPANGIVPSGEWFITPAQQGPSGPGPETPVTVNTAFAALTQAFDPAVTSGTGDLWAASTNALAPFNPYIVGPGQTALIPVTITPSGPVGSTVTGTIYLASASLVTYAALVPLASDVAAFPYTYTIK